MSLRVRAILAIVIIIFGLSASFFKINYSERKQTLMSRTERDSILIKNILNSVITELDSVFKARINGFVSINDKIMEAMKTKDGDFIYETAQRRFNALKKEYPDFRNISFISPDYTVIQMMIRKDFKNIKVDDLPFLSEVIEDRKTVSGMFMTKGGVRYVIAAPAYYKEEFVGAVVFSIMLNKILNGLNTGTDIKYSVYVDTKMLKAHVHKEYKPDTVDPYVIVQSNDEKMFNRIGLDILDKEDRSLLKDNEKSYMKHSFPLRNHLGKTVATIILLSDVTNYYNNFTKSVTQIVIVSISGILISFVILYLSFGKMAARIEALNKNLENKVAERTKELEDVNKNLESCVKDEIRKRLQNEQLLFQQSKFADMGRMVSAIAHQWRQPLNSLGLNIQDMEDAKQHDELTDEYLHANVVNCMDIIGHMSETIDDFRNFFKSSDNPESFCLTKVMFGMVNLVKAQMFHNNIKVVMHVEDDSFDLENFSKAEQLCRENAHNVCGVLGEFKQVVLNLFSNAVDAVLDREDERYIHIRIAKSGERIYLEISDNGGGIPEEYMGRVFDPYFTTKDDKQGTGIGLYLAKIIIEDHMKGQITVKNTGDGASFLINIPYCV